MSSNILLESALSYAHKGLSIVATDGFKKSIIPWTKFQKDIATREEIDQMFTNTRCKGVGIICGEVSGGLECIDIDLKYDISGDLYERIVALIEKILPGLFERLRIVQTKSGGYHFFYRCECIEGNQKLAQRNCTDEEKKESPHLTVHALIETRGNKGYAIAPPTVGYTLVQDKEIPVITIDERESLLSVLRSFNEVITKAQSRPEESNKKEVYALSPWEDFDQRGDINSLLENHGWVFVYESGGRSYYRRPGKSDGVSADFHREKNMFKVFSTSTNFEAGKGYVPSAVYSVLECGGDFSRAAKQLSENGFGNKLNNSELSTSKQIQKLKKKGMSIGDIIRKVSYEKGISEAAATEEIDKIEQSLGSSILKFWDIDDNGKMTINRTGLISFLEENGFYQYSYSNYSLQLIRVINGVIEESTTEQIKKFIKEYINQLPDRFDNGNTPAGLMELIMRGTDSYFSKGSLEYISRFNPDLLKDTESKAYFPFSNKVVEVTKEKVSLLSYNDLGKHIWKTQIIDFNIDSIDVTDLTNSEYLQFIGCISNNEMDRIDYAVTLIGYLLHKYKNPAKSFAPILAEETDNEDQGGGTGKGIFVKALQFMLPIVRVDGKNFKLDKGFAFQRVGLDTSVIAIEDVRKNVDFEGFYSIITEGITIEKKNRDELFLPYEQSPKLMFSTNYSIPNIGHHAKRRQKVLEFSSFFHPKHTPEDHFKHQLFVDWDCHEWNRFYNLMFHCVSEFLNKGIMEVENSEKIKRKQVRISFTPEFLDWWDDYLTESKTMWKLISDLHTDFLLMHDMDKKDYSTKRFRKALEDSAQIFGLKLEKRISRQNNNKAEYRIIDVVDL